jgi:hypothetical protein
VTDLPSHDPHLQPPTSVQPTQPPLDLDQVLRPPGPARKPNKLPWIIGGAFGLLVIIAATVGTTIAVTSDSGRATEAGAARPLSAWEQEQQDLAGGPGSEDEGGIATTPAVEPTTTGPVLSASDITLTPKVTEKQCFGSAGCNVSIKIDMAYRGPDLSPNETWEVTYEVKGDESGPIIGTFEITGDQYTVAEEALGTRSNKTKVTIKVTDVERLGY